MAVYSLSIGADVVIRGVDYKLIHKLEGGRLQFRQPETSEIHTLGYQDLLSLYANNEAEFQLKGLPTAGGAHWFSQYGDKPFIEYPVDEQMIALRRERYVKFVLGAGVKYFTKKLLDPVIEKCACNKDFLDPKPPSWISVYRWSKRYLASGRDIRSLVDHRASQGNDHPRIDGRVRELAIKALDEDYLTEHRHDMGGDKILPSEFTGS